MFGNKKKHLKNDREHDTKKKWQLEMEEEQDEVIPENLEIPKDTSEGDEQDLAKEQDAEENKENGDNNEAEEQDDETKKEFEWMSSEDEMDNEGAAKDKKEENQEIQASKEPEEAEEVEEEKKSEEDARTIFVSNIPLDASDEDVLSRFREFGTLLNVEIPRNEGARLNKGRAFIEYSSVEEAKQAVENPPAIKGNHLQVTLGLSTATTMMAAAQKDTPFVYDERSHRYRKAEEMDLINAQKKKDGESESGSSSGSESGSDSGSSSGSSDSESEKSDKSDMKLTKKKKSPSQSDDEDDKRRAGRGGRGGRGGGRGGKGYRNNKSGSRSRSKSKSPVRVKPGKRR